MEEKNQEINESNASKRLRLLGENMDEKIHSTEDEIKKGNFWQNLWYQHKWTIIISLFIVISIVILVAFLIPKKDEPDILIYYAGPVYLSDSANQSTITSGLEMVAKDYNEDGKASVQLVTGVLYANNQLHDEKGNPFTTTEIGRNRENINTFKNQLMSGEFSVLLIDKALYEQEFMASNGFKRLSDVGINASSDIMLDECSIYLKKTELGKVKALENLPDSTLIVVNYKTILADDEEYANHIDYLKEILSYVAK